MYASLCLSFLVKIKLGTEISLLLLPKEQQNILVIKCPLLFRHPYQSLSFILQLLKLAVLLSMQRLS